MAAVLQVQRSFEDVAAVRGPTPLLFGIIGPSGGGKTFSALRISTGIQRVVGGDIFFIDTESNRALHYADRFKFRHVPFGAPFSSLDYLAAIEHCARKGAKTIIVDSMSHEHEGPGGMLEEHDAEVDRLISTPGTRWTEASANIPAWSKPKAKRRRLINCLLQMQCNFVFCFRAKDKIKLRQKGESGEKITQLGFMPIAGEEFVYELTAKCLLMPGANGIPTWQPSEVGEKMMVKLPEQFRQLFSGEPRQLDEQTGEKLAEWSQGGAKSEDQVKADEIIGALATCAADGLDALLTTARETAKKLAPGYRAKLADAAESAKKRMAA